jgi:hypothetical protein
MRRGPEGGGSTHPGAGRGEGEVTSLHLRLRDRGRSNAHIFAISGPEWTFRSRRTVVQNPMTRNDKLDSKPLHHSPVLETIKNRICEIKRDAAEDRRRIAPISSRAGSSREDIAPILGGSSNPKGRNKICPLLGRSPAEQEERPHAETSDHPGSLRVSQAAGPGHVDHAALPAVHDSTRGHPDHQGRQEVPDRHRRDAGVPVREDRRTG